MAGRSRGCDQPRRDLDYGAFGRRTGGRHFIGRFGSHTLLAFLDSTGEALAGVLRPGYAGSNNAAGHITVSDAALAWIPDSDRYGQPRLAVWLPAELIGTPPGGPGPV